MLVKRNNYNPLSGYSVTNTRSPLRLPSDVHDSGYTALRRLDDVQFVDVRAAGHYSFRVH